MFFNNVLCLKKHLNWSDQPKLCAREYPYIINLKGDV